MQGILRVESIYIRYSIVMSKTKAIYSYITRKRFKEIQAYRNEFTIPPSMSYLIEKSVVDYMKNNPPE